jgi:entry exclusion lipoprotein TrbK
MRAALFSSRAWIAVACTAVVLAGCGKKEETPPSSYVMPEVNDANCKFDAIKAMPSDAQQKFADLCTRRPKPIRSEQKSYNF